jgi:hypothetical protein
VVSTVVLQHGELLYLTRESAFLCLYVALRVWTTAYAVCAYTHPCIFMLIASVASSNSSGLPRLHDHHEPRHSFPLTGPFDDSTLKLLAISETIYAIASF